MSRNLTDTPISHVSSTASLGPRPQPFGRRRWSCIHTHARGPQPKLRRPQPSQSHTPPPRADSRPIAPAVTPTTWTRSTNRLTHTGTHRLKASTARSSAQRCTISAPSLTVSPSVAHIFTCVALAGPRRLRSSESSTWRARGCHRGEAGAAAPSDCEPRWKQPWPATAHWV